MGWRARSPVTRAVPQRRVRPVAGSGVPSRTMAFIYSSATTRMRCRAPDGRWFALVAGHIYGLEDLLIVGAAQ